MKIIRKLLLAGLFFTQSDVFGASENAPNSRTEQWQQQRVEKLQHIDPYQQGKLEKYLLRFEERAEQKERIRFKRIYFQGGTISSGSSLALGATYWQPNIRDSVVDLQVSAAYSLREYQQYGFQFGKIPQNQPKNFLRSTRLEGLSQFDKIPQRDREFFLYGDLSYRDYPQEDFFGIGPQSSEEDRTDYELREVSYETVTGYQFNEWLRTDARLGFLQVDIDSGTDDGLPDTQEQFDETSAPGLTEQPDFFRLLSSVIVDFRDKPENPHQGGLVGFSFARYDDTDNSGFSFNRFAANARGYLPLGSFTRVLAVQFYTSLSNADEGNQIPFYFQEFLGSSDTLRGFKNFRFRDTDLLYLSAEYRWEPSQFVEFALFYDTGKVFSDKDDFDFNDLEDSYGIGMRIKTLSSVVFRIDLGFSDEDTQIRFKFSSSF
jgi:hypothetical protein